MVPSFPSVALVRRELLVNLRRTRSFVCLALFVVACALVPALGWPSEQTSLVAAAAISSFVFSVLVTVAVGAAVVLLPGLAAASLAAEHEQNTYDLLQLTLIRSTGIVLAKFVNVLGFYLLLCVAALPVLGLVLFLVGIDWVEVARAVATVFFNALACAAIGILYGSLFRRTAHAVVYAYLGVILFYVLGMIGVLAVGRAFNVFAAPIALYGLGWLYFAVVTVVCLVKAARYLPSYKRTAPSLTPGKPIDDPAVLEARRKQFPFYLIDPLRRKPGIGDRSNPVLVKELRLGLITRANVAIRVFYTALVIGAAVNITVAWPGLFLSMRNYEEGIGVLMLAQCCLAALAVPLLMANAFIKERESGNMDMLRMTLLTPRRIVLGKLAAGLTALAPLLLALTLAGVPLMVITAGFGRSLNVLLAGYPTLYVSTWVAACLALYVSVWAKRTTVALVVTYLIAAAVLPGLPGVAILAMMGDAGIVVTTPALREPLAISSPWWAYRMFADPRPWDTHCLQLWLLSLAVHTLLGWVLVAMSVSRFRVKHMRDA